MNKFLTILDIYAKFNTNLSKPVSVTTLKDRLTKASQNEHVAVKKLLFCPVNMKKKLAWTKAH